MTNEILTAILRMALVKNGYLAAESYEWFDGEALYHGEPIQGRCTDGEAKAVNVVLESINLRKQIDNARRLQYNASQMRQAGQVCSIQRQLETMYRKLDSICAKLK